MMKSPCRKGILLTVLASALAAVSLAYGQGVSSISTDKSFTIPRTSERPVMDGMLSMGEWDDAVLIDDFHQVFPIEFTQASQRTVVYLKYDQNNLYVAVYAFDSEPDRIVANVNRQGAAVWNDDNFNFLIDPFNNDRSGYNFEINPNGIRVDAIYTNGSNSDDDWEGVWTGAARIVEDGWTGEFTIPFKTISFDPTIDTWGVSFWRNIERESERVAWTSFNGSTNPTTAGEMSGIFELSQGVGLDLIPTLSAIYAEDHVIGNSESDVQPSLDLNYKLSPNWSLTATFNTDFAATEADGRQLDLGRFSPSFPEKRSFFLTDFDIFSFGDSSRATGIGAADSVQPFFSRRIGIGAGGVQADILGGLKLAGRVGDLDVGTLVMYQDEYSYESRGRTLTNDATEIAVVRLLHPVFEESTIGVLATYGDPRSNDQSSTVAVDFAYNNDRLPGGRELEALMWLQKANNPGMDGDDMAWNAQISFPSRQSWTAGAQYLQIQDNFDPRLGQIRRDTGVRYFSGGGSYKWLISGDLVRDVTTSLSGSQWEYLDTGELQSRQVSWQVFSIQTPGSDRVRLSLSQSAENIRPGERRPLSSLGIDIPEGEFEFSRVSFAIRTSGARPVSGRFDVDYGDYYNGQRLRVSPSVEWRINRFVTLELGYRFTSYQNFPIVQQFTEDDEDNIVPVQDVSGRNIFSKTGAIVRQIDIESEVVFNESLSVDTTIEYDNVSQDIGFNSRLRWNIAPGQDVWFVVSHNSADEYFDDRFPDMEHPTFGYNYSDFDKFGSDTDLDFKRESTNVAFKIRYTHRF